MWFKSTSYLAAHYPNTYMEQFCKTIHPGFDLETVCVAWFRQATEHCSVLLSEAMSPRTYFWTTFRNFIFPDRSTAMISSKVPISIHPKRLSIHDCHSLYSDIVSDYIQRAPRYSAESTTNAMLWQVFYSFFGIMVLVSLLLCTIYTYNKYSPPEKMINYLEEFFKPAKRMQAIAKRSLRLSKAELRNLHVKALPRKEDIIAANGTAVLALKVVTKYEFFENLVQCSAQAVGKLHRLHESNTKTEFKVETINTALKFIDNGHKNLHLLLLFEDHNDSEDEVAVKKSKISSPRMKMISPIYCNLSTLGRSITNTRLDAGAGQHKATAKPADYGISSIKGSPRLAGQTLPNTPRTLNTPRSSGSSIPRNFRKTK